MGFSNSLLRAVSLTLWRSFCYDAVKAGARSNPSSENLKEGSRRSGKMERGGTADFFWMGLALGSSWRYSKAGLLYSIQTYYKIIYSYREGCSAETGDKKGMTLGKLYWNFDFFHGKSFIIVLLTNFIAIPLHLTPSLIVKFLIYTLPSILRA
jgi:hypothetical protein